MSIVRTMLDSLPTCIKMFIPSHVSDVWHIDDRECKVRALYRGRKHMFYWPNAFADTIFASNHGYFMFKVWCHSKRKHVSMLLSSKHVCSALGITTASNMWALSDLGMVMQLVNYVLMCSRVNDVFAIMIDGADVTDAVAEYLPSLAIERNVTPRALQLLYYHVRGVPFPLDREVDTYFVDYELRESRYGVHDFIVG